MFDDHAAHLYDYCLALLADEAEAASAAKVTLIAAYKLGGRMTEPGQLRAWMFALGRRECRSDSPIRREPWVAPRKRSPVPPNGSEGLPLADAETREFARIDPADALRTGFEAEIRRVVQMPPLTEPVYPPPPDCYTEVHDLVQRHRIAPAELPMILDVSAGEAEDLLAAVPGMVPADRRDHPGPLARMPRNLWRETASVVFDPEHAWLCEAIAADAGRLWADGFPEDPVEVMPPSHKRMAATSVGLAAALLAPAALGAGLYAAFAVSPHSVTRSHETAIAPPQGSHPTTNGSGSSATSGRTHQKARHSVTSIFPTAPTSAPILPTPNPKPKQTTPTTHGRTSSPPVIKSGPPSKSPSPSPSPTSPAPTSPAPTSPAPTSPAPTSPSQSLPANEGVSPSPTSSPSPSDPSPSPSG
jgi:hypothetical protein